MNEAHYCREPLLGSRIFGFSAILMGIVGLMWRDFATVWQPVPADVPHRAVLAVMCSLVLLGAGIAMQFRNSVRAAALVLASIYSIFTLLWLPRVIAFPRILTTWDGAAEELALVLAALASAWWHSSNRQPPTLRIIFGLCLCSFGFEHFYALKETTQMVPLWVPGTHRFWALATGLAFVAAGVSLVVNRSAKYGALCTTAQITGFGAFVWAPMLVTDPRNHMVWAGNALNLALVGAAWTMTEVVSRSA